MPGQRGRFFAQQAFGRRDPRQLIGELPGGKTGRQEAARRKLDPGQPHGVARRHGRQKVARPRIEQGIVGDGAGRNDARHLAAHQPLGQLGVFDLFANGRPQSGGDQLAQVAVQLVIGKAGHGRGVLALLAAGQREVEHAGGRLGIVVKHLVEVAHAKQQQRVGTRPLRFLVLLHHGGDGHAAMLTTQGGRGKGEGGRGRTGRKSAGGRHGRPAQPCLPRCWRSRRGTHTITLDGPLPCAAGHFQPDSLP